MVHRLERNVLNMSFSAMWTFKLLQIYLYKRMPVSYGYMAQKDGSRRFYVHPTTAMRTSPVVADGVQHPGKGAVEGPCTLAGRQNRAAAVEAWKVGGKLQEAETAGVCEQRIGMGAGAGSLRKGADWGNAHGREPRLGWIVCFDLSTLSEGSFFSSRFTRLRLCPGEPVKIYPPACRGTAWVSSMPCLARRMPNC